MNYAEFLASKRILSEPCGFDVAESDINPMLFPFQRDICRWALRGGKRAVFAHTGLGKGPIQLEWCRHVSLHTNGNTLILAPLAVSQQFKREAAKFHIPVTLCREQSDVCPGINVTNYERMGLFDLHSFAGVAMDESSCIKDWTSKTAKDLIEQLADTPFKLCSTATPSPNDHAELGTHAELLDVMRRSAMLAMFFEHDGGETAKWSLKGHGRRPFWKFVASWAVCLLKPSDLGYDDEGFNLPPLHLREHIVEVDQSISTDGMLFRCPDMSATGIHKEMRLTCDDRARKVAELVESGWNLDLKHAKILVCGSPNIKQTENAKSLQIQNTPLASLDISHPGRRKKTKSICESTINSIQTSSPEQSRKGLNETTPGDQGISLILNTGNVRSEKSKNGSSHILKCDLPNECASTDYAQPTMTGCLQPNMDVAQFAERQPQAATEGLASMLITAMQLGKSEDYSASVAISASDNSKTIQNSSSEPSNISQLPQWIVWCNTNYEQEPLAEIFGDLCISIEGSMSPEKKESGIARWLDNDKPILLTKPSVAGYGLNLQQCHNMAFVGLSYSFEDMFQAIRRCWRFGQTQPVNAHIVVAETEGSVLSTIRRKEAQYEELQQEMNVAMREEQLAARHKATRYDHETEMEIPEWLARQTA